MSTHTPYPHGFDASDVWNEAASARLAELNQPDTADLGLLRPYEDGADIYAMATETEVADHARRTVDAWWTAHLAAAAPALAEALRWAMRHVENVFALADRNDAERTNLDKARAALSLLDHE